MQKEIKITTKAKSEVDNLNYWLSVSPNKKLSILQELREQYISLFNKQELYNESRKRLRRVSKIIKRI